MDRGGGGGGGGGGGINFSNSFIIILTEKYKTKKLWPNYTWATWGERLPVFPVYYNVFLTELAGGLVFYYWQFP